MDCGAVGFLCRVKFDLLLEDIDLMLNFILNYIIIYNTVTIYVRLILQFYSAISRTKLPYMSSVLALTYITYGFEQMAAESKLSSAQQYLGPLIG